MIIPDTSVWIEYLKRNVGYQLTIEKFLMDKKILLLILFLENFYRESGLMKKI